jgi:hypothetical protein
MFSKGQLIPQVSLWLQCDWGGVWSWVEGLERKQFDNQRSPLEAGHSPITGQAKQAGEEAWEGKGTSDCGRCKMAFLETLNHDKMWESP